MEFNEKQKKVINILNKNILLLSSAGTGKTRTLSARISKILKEERAKGEEIICLTFTNRGAKEMKEKLQEVGRKALNVTVKTFHSFCFDIIKSQAKKNTDVSFDFIIYDEQDSLEVIEELNVYKFNVNSLQNFINKIKEFSIKNIYLNINEKVNELKNKEEKNYRVIIEKFIQYNKKQFFEICREIGGYNTDYKLTDYLEREGYILIETYNKILQERHALDFNDLIIEAYDLFQREEVVYYWRRKFKYIHIDEVQDTSEEEYNIIAKLFKGNNVMLSGDFYQTIYKWRGSNPSYILKKYKKEFNPVEIIFNENYRSSEVLLKASYNYLTHAFGNEVREVYKEGIIPNSNIKGELIKLQNTENIDYEAQWIFKKIKELDLKDISKVAILTRSNRINIELSERFNRINSHLSPEDRLKFLLVDEFKFFRRQEIKDVLAYLKLIINEFDNNSFKRVLKRFGKGIGEKTIQEIEKDENYKIGVRLTDLINKNTQENGEYYELLMRELDKNNVVIFDVESTGVNTTEDDIVQIAAIKIDGNGKVIDKFEKFLIPSKTVGTSELVHGFSDKFLKEKGEDSKEVLHRFCKFIKETIIVGHNVTFDLTILNSQLQRYGLPKAEYKSYYDTLDISRRFYPNLKNHKLETLSKLFETETRSSHDAMDDILATKDVLLSMIKEKVYPTLLQRMSVYSKYIIKFKNIYEISSYLKQASYTKNPKDLIVDIINLTKIKEVYKNDENKIWRLREFYCIAKEMEREDLCPMDNLIELLKTTSLSNSELDRMLVKNPKIPIITIHQAKGAEFEYVFLAGLQQGTFPNYLAIKENNLEEEKRLFYVGMTRAKKGLYLSYSCKEKNRIKKQSELIDYIDKNFIE
ncbi:helicase [Clostridiaceae bacterium 14S0207]|nr:helicase [Clostridiaceae bacterium 14S0207]